MKRARKYEAALGIISHSLVDFLHESIKQYGQALLDIPCYKILMGTDGKNLKETADLYDLTEAEQELLLARKRDTLCLWQERSGFISSSIYRSTNSAIWVKAADDNKSAF